VEQMYALSRRELRTIWGGVQGERWYYHIRGEVIPSEKSQRGSFGNSHVLDPEHRSVRKALPVLERLLMKAAARLRTHGFRSGRLTVFVRHRYERQAYVWQAEAHFAPISDTISAIQALKKIWSGRPNGLVPYAVGVTFTDLVTEANHTPSLFDRDDKRLALSRAMDKVNGAFGKNKVYIGGASDALETTPVRIAFRNIPDMGVENLM
ncbi:MAG: DNA polymerase, partial [Verrucomicrobiae bacterium]|nr:DNA polymerase [Verrucomicrobiae bacterium]